MDRGQISQPNSRWKALDEIYRIYMHPLEEKNHIPLHLSDLKNSSQFIREFIILVLN